MNTGTGVLSIVLALAALLVTAAGSKSAQARPSHTSLKAFKASTTKMATLANAVTAANEAQPLPQSEARDTPGASAIATQAPAERVSPPHLLENRGLRRLKKAETSPAMLKLAANVVKRHYTKPVGTEITVEVEGQQIVARIERHFHPEGGTVKPWGFHPGVSLFIKR